MLSEPQQTGVFQHQRPRVGSLVPNETKYEYNLYRLLAFSPRLWPAGQGTGQHHHGLHRRQQRLRQRGGDRPGPEDWDRRQASGE